MSTSHPPTFNRLFNIFISHVVCGWHNQDVSFFKILPIKKILDQFITFILPLDKEFSADSVTY